MACERDQQSPGEMVLGLRDFYWHVRRQIDGFQSVHRGYVIGKKTVDERRLLEFCHEKELCVPSTWFEK